MDTRTKHDQEQHELEQERYWREKIERLRQDLARLCPAGQILDDEQLVAVIGQQWSTNRPYLLARRFVRAGMATQGVSVDVIEQVFGPAPRPGEASYVPSLYWDPPDELLRDIPEKWRKHVIRGRSAA